MTLEQAKFKFLNKRVNIDWNFGLKQRDGAIKIPLTENVVCVDIWESFDKRLFCKVDSKITVPVLVERLILIENFTS